MGLRILKLMTVLLFVTGIFSCTKNKLSSEKEILSFQILGAEGEISEVSAGDMGTIKVFLPSIILTGHLSPDITVSDKATIFPESGAVQSFSGNVATTYTVTAQDGSQQKYAVTVHPRQPKILLNDIPHLFLQPLPVIQEQMQGKWKLQLSSVVEENILITSIDKQGSYMHITMERIIMGNNSGIITDSPIIWAEIEDPWGQVLHYIPVWHHMGDPKIKRHVSKIIPRGIVNNHLYISTDISNNHYVLFFTKYE
ncbi:MAG: DUF5018 domain-containing protein [Bacteroidales bacterium]|nr:DUF5018 domain-containing protein [Bacteroidales bacterium]